jgi:aspartyl-tRNA(Asn)/glutamyl-tRNA(Gln) amidotransferase subunit B
MKRGGVVEYEAVIGLEVHAQLRTRSKMFCACPTGFGAPPNSQVCPVCLGHPGALPVVNREAVRLAAGVGLAVGGTVHSLSLWSRKNYFYPDLPKGYQITQYDRPLVTGGGIEVESPGGPRRIAIARMHLEEDAGKSMHPERRGETMTLVDLNRCGIPLLEIVSEPEIRSSQEAYSYLVNLKQILQYCDACEGDMERGSLRCDANISIRPRGDPARGIKTEIKNLNSFRNVQRALEVEFARQVALRDAGEPIEPDTRLWDQLTGQTRVMRSKEEAHDYRYFPEPDLPPLRLDAAWLAPLRRQLPELPGPRRARFMRQYGLKAPSAGLLTGRRQLADYFERVLEQGVSAKRAASFIGSVLLRELGERGLQIEQCPAAPDALAELLRMQADGILSSRLGKQVLGEMVASGRSARAIVQERGWDQVEDASRLRAWAREVMAAHPAQVRAYRAGKGTLLRFFMGQVMKRSRGRAHPAKAEEILVQLLAE